MTPGERLAAALPREIVEELARVLRVDHPGTTRLEICHGPGGRITHIDITPASIRVAVQSRQKRTER